MSYRWGSGAATGFGHKTPGSGLAARAPLVEAATPLQCHASAEAQGVPLPRLRRLLNGAGGVGPFVFWSASNEAPQPPRKRRQTPFCLA